VRNDDDEDDYDGNLEACIAAVMRLKAQADEEIQVASTAKAMYVLFADRAKRRYNDYSKWRREREAAEEAYQRTRAPCNAFVLLIGSVVELCLQIVMRASMWVLDVYAANKPTARQYECQVCAGEYKDPRVAPCGHSICFACWVKVLKIACSCPICRAPVRDTGALIRNYAMF